MQDAGPELSRGLPCHLLGRPLRGGLGFGFCLAAAAGPSPGALAGDAVVAGNAVATGDAVATGNAVAAGEGAIEEASGD